MQTEALKTAMMDSISEVLEGMFYLALDFKDDAKTESFWDSEKDKILATQIEFSGPIAGCFIFTVPDQLALSTTADFLGMEQPDSDHVAETVKEIINMVAGNAFSKFDDQAVFDLKIPESKPFDDVKAIQVDPEKEIFIGIDTLDGWLAFQLVLEGRYEDKY
jgi:CheY-specific phosphatase CheX